MKHAHQTTKPRPDLDKYPMPTAETAWAIAQEFVAARRRMVEAVEEYAATMTHRGRATVDLVTDEQYQRYFDEMTALDQRWAAAWKAINDTCTCPDCALRRSFGK